MLDFKKVKFVVQNWFGAIASATSAAVSTCNHTYKFVDQFWDKTKPKNFVLKNRHLCVKCHSVTLKNIGEK